MCKSGQRTLLYVSQKRQARSSAHPAHSNYLPSSKMYGEHVPNPQSPSTPQKTRSLLQTKPFSTGKHRSTELEAAVATQTVPVTPVIHLLPPHQTTPHAPGVEGLSNPSYVYSDCPFNQRCPARPLATSGRGHHLPGRWEVGRATRLISLVKDTVPWACCASTKHAFHSCCYYRWLSVRLPL